MCLFEDGFDLTGIRLFLCYPCLEAAPAWTSRRGGDREKGMQTQSPMGGVSKVGVQEGEQVLHWKLSMSAHSSRCGNTRAHVPDSDCARRLSLTSESAKERKWTTIAVHQSGRRSRCRGPPCCPFKPVPSFATGLCCGGFVIDQRRAPCFSGIKRNLPVRDTELWVSITGLARRFFSAQPCDCFFWRPERL